MSKQSMFHNLSVDRLSNLFRVGDYNEVIVSSNQLLKRQSNLLEILRFKAAAYAKLHMLEEELDTNLTIIKWFPTDADAYLKIGTIHLQTKDADNAIAWLTKANSLCQNDFWINKNLASAYILKKHPEIAFKFLSIAAEIKPSDPEVLVELGNLALQLNYTSSAKRIYQQAISISDKYPELYNNLGVICLDSGDPLGAAAYLYKALLINPKLHNIAEALQEIACQISDGEVTAALDQYLEQSRIFKTPGTRATFLPLQAVSAYKAGRLTTASNIINSIEPSVIDHPFRDPVSEKKAVFKARYLSFLKILIEGNSLDPLPTKDVIFHIGDSHCLSFAHKEIFIEDKKFRIHPRLCFGLKAFHLGEDGMNRYKGIVAHHLHKIPTKSKVFFSAGEIDCRRDEGIIQASLKSQTDIGEITKKTVRLYVSALIKLNDKTQHDLHIVNVPAPMVPERGRYAEDFDNRLLIENFNFELDKQIKRHNLKLIDVYKFTKGKDGFSTGVYHCDYFHLGNKALREIQNQITN